MSGDLLQGEMGDLLEIGEMLSFFPPPGKAGKSLTRLGGGAAGAGGSVAFVFSVTSS